MPKCLRVVSAGGTDSIILSGGGAESMMLSACAESMDTLSAGTESIILSAPPAESMILSAVSFCYYATLTASGDYIKRIIGNTDNHRLMTLANSASMAAPIGLLPKGAKFCLISNRLLVGRQCHHALLRLYFNSSAVSRLVVCWSVGRSVGQPVGRSTIRVPRL